MEICWQLITDWQKRLRKFPDLKGFSSEPTDKLLNVEYQRSLGRTYLAVVRLLGLTLRHELGHIAGNMTDLNTDELVVDTSATRDFLEAVDCYQRTGDSSKLFLVFTNPQGFLLTDTKNQPTA